MNNKIEQKNSETLLERINREINDKKKDEEILIKEEETINEFNTFLELISAVDKINDRRLFFRGQSNVSDSSKYQEWELESSLKRKIKIKNKAYFYQDLRTYTFELLKHIGTRKGIKNNEYNNLKFLSEMQHYGNPTILIDFTSDFKTALWFSASDQPPEKNKNEHFSVFIFELVDKNPKNILSENDWENNFNNNIYLCPPNLNRGLAQKSFFLFDINLSQNSNENIKDKLNIIQINISYKIQDEIKNYLYNKQITAETLFPDLSGLYKSFEESGSVMYFFERGLYFMSLSNYDKTTYEEAAKNFEKIIEIEPRNSEAYNNWGNALSNLKKYDKAIEKYQKAIQLNPNLAEAYNNWGVVLNDQKEYEKAIEKYQKAIQINPNYAKAYNNWGIVLNLQEEYEKAIEKYQKAIQINPNYAKAYNNWGVVLNEQKEYEKAIEKYQKAIQLNPNSQITYILLSGLIDNGMNLNMDQINDLIEVLNKNSKLINDKNLIGKINNIKNKLLEKKKNL